MISHNVAEVIEYLKNNLEIQVITVPVYTGDSQQLYSDQRILNLVLAGEIISQQYLDD